MAFFESKPVPCTRKKVPDKIFFENEFIRWIHDAASGKLTGAVVKNGSGENLLTAPATCRIIRKENGQLQNYDSEIIKGTLVSEKDSLIAEYQFRNSRSGILPAFRMKYQVKYGSLGEGEHTLTLIPEKPLKNISFLQPVILGIRQEMNWLGIRNRYVNSPGYFSQNPVEWHPLHGGNSFQDCIPWLNCHIPLSILFLKTGEDGIQFEIGDDLSVWESCRSEQESAVIYDAEKKGFLIRLSPVFAHEGVTISEPLTLKYRLTLPYVRKNIVPFRKASNLFYFNRGFSKRWPSEKDYALMEKAGYDLLRLHCDDDRYKNGIFWRDAVYPPFPAEEMKKMERCIAAAHKHNIHVVPYFSVKEIHPDAENYSSKVRKWAELGNASRPVRTSVFGSVMCLNSAWNSMRRKTIEQVLQNHAFDGIYYDWCCGLECDNKKHASQIHWDNDALLSHIYWTADRYSEAQSERYIHVTNVPSLSVENAATMLIAEENSFPHISPFMFSPQVHFLNIAPRQICDMLPDTASDTDKKRLALCALLHHASVSSIDAVYLDFYARLPWLDSIVKYTHHAAPGEGIISGENPDTGFSVYWNESECMIVGINLSGKTEKTKYTVKLPQIKKWTGTMNIKPLSASIKIQKIKYVQGEKNA